MTDYGHERQASFNQLINNRYLSALLWTVRITLVADVVNRQGCLFSRQIFLENRAFLTTREGKNVYQDSRYKTQNITDYSIKRKFISIVGAQLVSKLLLEKHLARIIQRVMLYIQAHLYLIISERSQSR